jgi:hypothetical protein
MSGHSLLRRLRGVLLLSLVAIAAGVLWLALDDRFYVYKVDVAGVLRVKPDEVFQASRLPGLHILWVRPTEVETRILDALPSIESAQVVCGLQLPAECAITVVERQPRVVWDEDGQSWWIDANGVIFPAPSSFPPIGGEEEGRAEGWLVQGPLPQDEDGLLDERVRVALSELWAAGVDVSPLLYVPGRGLVFTDERGWRVIVGVAGDRSGGTRFDATVC